MFRHVKMPNALLKCITIFVLLIPMGAGDQKSIPPTQIPVVVTTPTLTPGQTKFEQLLRKNVNCELPCWWGFNIGEATKDEWLNFLDTRKFNVFREEPLSDGRQVAVDYAYLSFPESSETSVLINYLFRDNILTQLDITIHNPHDWLSRDVETITLPGVLRQLGNPKIYIFTDSLGQITQWVSIGVVDEESNMSVFYRFDLVDESQWLTSASKVFTFCFDISLIESINLLIQESEIAFSKSLLAVPGEGSGYHPINTIFDLSDREFIELASESRDGCLDLELLPSYE